MARLENVSIAELHAALDDVEGKKPTKRLLAAISYKKGVTQTELAEWYDVDRRTIYRWFIQLENESLAEAVVDAPRSGRPRKLPPDEQNRLETILREPPTENGVNAPAWTTRLLQEFIRETFCVDYSLPSCRRLLKEAGLSYQKPRRTAAEADPAEQDAFREELKKSDGRWTPR